MEIKFALKRQYHAGLAMLRECVEKSSDEIWLSGKHPRNFWRIAYHAVFFTHLYLGQTVDDCTAWEKHRESATSLWESENPEVLEPYSKTEILGYINLVDQMIDETVDGLDLACETTGIPWYKNMGKLEHEILNIRHLQTHVGQLSELLIENGVEGNYWMSRG
jgi:hypothetical protein